MGASFDCLPLHAARPPFLANSQQLTANNCQLYTVTCQLIFTYGSENSLTDPVYTHERP
jgi:hypothetical protein